MENKLEQALNKRIKMYSEKVKKLLLDLKDVEGIYTENGRKYTEEEYKIMMNFINEAKKANYVIRILESIKKEAGIK